MTTPPIDQPARDRITNHGLDETLFVEAGAGTGKTTALVGRIVSLVIERNVPVTRIAAITFTEAAAAELKDRVRAELERRLAGTSDPALETTIQGALDDLDGAAMQTLHAFAQRILSLYPLEAGLPPQITVADDIRSAIEFDAEWQQYLDSRLSTANPDFARAFLLGLTADHLKSLARAFGGNLDRIRDANFSAPSFALQREFDTAILLHVLEHLFEPEEVLKKIAAAIRPGGSLIGGFPVVPGPLAGIRESQVRKTAKPMGHVSVFSPARVRRMAAQAGLQVEFMSGAFLMRSKGSALENSSAWMRFNIAWGRLFPGWPGEIYWLMRKPA